MGASHCRKETPLEIGWFSPRIDASDFFWMIKAWNPQFIVDTGDWNVWNYCSYPKLPQVLIEIIGYSWLPQTREKSDFMEWPSFEPRNLAH